MGIPQIDIHIEDESRDLLNHTCNGNVGTELLRQVYITTAAGLQIAGVRRSIDG